MHLYLQGVSAGNPPSWINILEAANNDPLRAQEIEAGLCERWWEYYKSYRRQAARIQREEELRRK